MAAPEAVDAAEDQPGDEIVIATGGGRRHRTVSAEITGPNGEPLSMILVVDTGATLVVLPESAIARLGFDPDELGDGVAQTARGQVRIRTGRLGIVTLAGREQVARAEDVEVAFLPDRDLGGKALLGMSFLGRFRVTIDDRRAEIILVERP